MRSTVAERTARGSEARRAAAEDRVDLRHYFAL